MNVQMFSRAPYEIILNNNDMKLAHRTKAHTTSLEAVTNFFISVEVLLEEILQFSLIIW